MHMVFKLNIKLIILYNLLVDKKIRLDDLLQVEIVMGLEEEFDISVEEESSQNISTVQEAADLIEKLVEKRAAA